MPVTNGFVDVAYGIQLVGDPELMFVTQAWEAVSGPPATEDLEGHYGRFITSVRVLLDSSWTFPECRFTFGTTTGNVPIVINPETPVAGNRATSPPLPNNCAVLIRKATALGGRKNRGRMFFPGPNEGQVDARGNLTTTERALFQTAIDGWQTAENAATLGWDPVLLHADNSAPTPIIGYQVQIKTATQRRRMRP